MKRRIKKFIEKVKAMLDSGNQYLSPDQLRIEHDAQIMRIEVI